MIWKHTQSRKKVISYTVEVKIIPNINTADQNVLHFTKNCLLYFLIRISWASYFPLLAPQVKNTVATSFYLSRFAQIFKLIFDCVLDSSFFVGNTETSTQQRFQPMDYHSYIVLLIDDKLTAFD